MNQQVANEGIMGELHDSLGIVTPDALYGTMVRNGEILSTAICDTLQSAEPFNPFLTAESAFGSASQLVAEERVVVPYVESLTDNPIFQSILLIVALAYMLMVCAHLNELLSLFSRDSRGEAHLLSNRSLQSASALGVIMLGGVAVQLLNDYTGLGYGTMTLLAGVVAGVVLLLLAQSLVLIASGLLTLTYDLSIELIENKIACFGLCTLLAMPFALLGVLSNSDSGIWGLWCAAAICSFVIILFLKESFFLFIRKKVSILHWFLYLCTVELLPLSFIYLSAIRW